MTTAEGRVSNFSYTDEALADRMVEGVAQYSYDNEQNIPLATLTDYNPTIINKGIRAQGASLPREGVNHFFGRTSYNVNMLARMFHDYITAREDIDSRNISEYDSTQPYHFGDTAYLITEADNQIIYTVYQRTTSAPDSIVDMSPSVHPEHWTVMRENTALSDVLPAGTNLRTVTHDGHYVPATEADAATITDIPNDVTLKDDDVGLFDLWVVGDRSNTEFKIQRIFYKNTGREYTRVIQGNNEIVYWYRSQAPEGANIVALVGAWIFRVEGTNLFLYYDDNLPPPAVYIDRTVGSPTYGHLLWEID